jgi:hypothetical protein
LPFAGDFSASAAASAPPRAHLRRAAARPPARSGERRRLSGMGMLIAMFAVGIPSAVTLIILIVD